MKVNEEDERKRNEITDALDAAKSDKEDSDDEEYTPGA